MGYSGNFNDVVNADYIAGTVTVGTSQVAARVGGSNLARRQEITIYNPTNNIIWVGPSGITASNTGGGIPLGPEETLSLQYGASIDIYLIAAQAGNTIVIQEAS